ncbi:MAG TPA: hypothetical protein VHH53_05980 [Pseudonocardiaceae bacterium]|nr:hypothetical protein [Pseudonocardiaceae bacterium]
MSVTGRRHIDVDQAPRQHPERRPCRGGRRFTALLCAVMFFLSPTIALSLGAQAARFENRPLAAFGDPRDGWPWLAGLPAWAADNLPFRDGAVRMAEAVSRNLFSEPARLPVPAVQSPVGPRAMAPIMPAAHAFPSVIEGRDGWLYLGADVSGACLPSRSLDDTLDSLRRIRGVVESSGRQFVLVVAPDKTTMVPEYLPAEYVGRDCSAQARGEFWRRVVAEAGAIDLRPALAEIARRKASPVYYPADTHWSQEGGLAMTYAVADRIASGITQSWQIAPAGSIPWPDDISPLIGRSGERAIPTYSLAPAGLPDRTRPVISDFRVPLHLSSAPAAGTVDRPVRMIADSFTQFASRYLAATFTNITVVHPDTAAAAPWSAGELLAGGDVVVLEVAERNLLSGKSPILLHPVITEIGSQLASRPVR